MNKEYNIVLTNLSRINENFMNKSSMYSSIIKGSEHFIEGIMTNEAGIKYVLEELKENNKVLDEIYYLSSEDIVKSISKNVSMTHNEFFIKQIEKYCEEYHYELPAITKHKNNIANNPSSKDLINISIDIMKYLLELKNKYKKVNLYIECNGGVREFVLIVVSLINTLHDTGINVKKVIGVNYDISSKTGEILDKTVAYNVIDLYSGVDEFINYGRSKKIEEYFNKSDIELTKEMQAVLDAIIDMSDAFSLCRPNEMFDKTKVLMKTIKAYQKTKHSPLFNYLTDKIDNEYKNIFYQFKMNKDINYDVLKAMLKFCTDHYLIQQAFTLYSEYMPVVFYDEGIITEPSDETLNKHYDKYLASKFSNINDPNTKAYKYTYIQSYLFVYRGGLLNAYNDDFNTNIKSGDTKNRCKILRSFFEKEYVYTDYNKEEAIEIMRDYLRIKEARNTSNHAGQDNKKDVMKYFKDTRSSVDYINKAIKRIDKLLNIK